MYLYAEKRYEPAKLVILTYTTTYCSIVYETVLKKIPFGIPMVNLSNLWQHWDRYHELSWIIMMYVSLISQYPDSVSHFAVNSVGTKSLRAALVRLGDRNTNVVGGPRLMQDVRRARRKPRRHSRHSRGLFSVRWEMIWIILTLWNWENKTSPQYLWGLKIFKMNRNMKSELRNRPNP